MMVMDSMCILMCTEVTLCRITALMSSNHWNFRKLPSAGLSRDIGRHFYVNAATRFVSENTKSLYTNTLRCDGFSWLQKFNFGGNFGPLNIQLGKDALDYASSEIDAAPCFQMNGMTSNMAKTLPRYQWTASAGLFAGPVFFNASLSTSPFSGKIFDSKKLF